MNSKTDLDLIKKLVRESNGFITGHFKLEEATKNLSDEFIVSYETQTGRYYLRCNTYLDFFIRIYMKTKNRFFHEIMTSERRKIYFDIDSKESAEEVKACITKLLSLIRNEIEDLNLNFTPDKDILLLNSSNETKQSYHLILPNHFCNRIVDLQFFAKRVVDKLEEKQKKMIDMGVYRRNQSFRMFNCMKRSDPKRILFPDNEYKIDLNEELKPFQHRRNRCDPDWWDKIVEKEFFIKSLISFTDREMKNIVNYPFIDIPKKGKVNTNDRWNLKLPDGLEFDKEIEYEDKYMLLYKNTNGYHCPSCDREHLQENPYVIVYKDPKQAFFKCRR